jgi:hypothetical protein
VSFVNLADRIGEAGRCLIDDYVRGRIAGTELERVLEEHLFVCDSCQDWLEAVPDAVPVEN